MNADDRVASAVRQYLHAREHVIVVTGALATVVQMACLVEDRTPYEQAALLVLAQCLESSGLPSMGGFVEQVWGDARAVGGRAVIHPDDIHDLEVDATVLDFRLALAEADLDALAERIDRLETELAELRRRRWWR